MAFLISIDHVLQALSYYEQREALREYHEREERMKATIPQFSHQEDTLDDWLREPNIDVWYRLTDSVSVSVARNLKTARELAGSAPVFRDYRSLWERGELSFDFPFHGESESEAPEESADSTVNENLIHAMNEVNKSGLIKPLLSNGGRLIFRSIPTQEPKTYADWLSSQPENIQAICPKKLVTLAQKVSLTTKLKSLV